MHGLGVPTTHAIGEALYVGLVTDTGPLHVREHRPAGARDGRRADRRRASTRTRSTAELYEGIPHGKLELLARGLTNAERFDGGLLIADRT